MAQYYHYHTDTSASSKDEFASAFSWKYSRVDASNGPADSVVDERDRLIAAHPLYVIPHQAAQEMRAWYERQPFET